jgi:phage terminase small subunit
MTMNYALPATIEADELSPAEEHFVARYVAHESAVKAFSEAFPERVGKSRHATRQRGYELVHAPRIAARIAQLRAVAADRALTSTDRLIQELEDIVAADPNELASLSVAACRHCHGVGHQYQWVDEDEWAIAAAAALDRGKAIPSQAGGVGFNANLSPSDECPKCSGSGAPMVRFTDTDKLSPQARRLFKGVELRPDGSVRVMMHDQLEARKELHRLRGMLVDRSVSINANVAVSQPSDLATPDALLAAFHALGNSL